MKVSVVIATYNRASLIGKSVESVLSQTHNNIELIIVDDGSTDETKEVIQKYIDTDKRVRYVALPKNKGATTARNRGVEEATGDLIMVWDSDDVLYPHALGKVIEQFIRNPKLGIVSAECQQEKSGQIIPHTALETGLLTLESILCRILPSCTKVRVARADIFKQVRYEARNIDFTVNGYLASLGQWYHLGEELGVLHLELDAVSLTSNRKRPNAERSMERVEPLLRYFEHFGEAIKEHCPTRYAALSYGLALGLLLRGDVPLSRYYASEAVRSGGLFLYRRLQFLTYIPGAASLLRFLFRVRGQLLVYRNA